jgi:hypothetical protein
MSIYERNPNAAPDTDFEPGELVHVAVGNHGRLLDPRRTPVTVVAVRPDLGAFVVRLDDFEDAGATWEESFDRVDRYQFARDSPRADAADVDRYRAAMERLDKPLRIAGVPEVAAATAARIDTAQRSAAAWLREHSAFLAVGAALPEPETRLADPRLLNDLDRYMTDRELAEIERAFAEQYVRNPYSGELVKGHRIVIAEMGLAAFEGTIVRDPALFDDPWSREHRAEHVTARLAFVRAIHAALGLDRVTLYRGMCTDEPIRPPGCNTFVSATYSRRVAESHFGAGPVTDNAMLLRQAVPARRLFMTYHETRAMNEHYREAEAILLQEPTDVIF